MTRCTGSGEKNGISQVEKKKDLMRLCGMRFNSNKNIYEKYEFKQLNLSSNQFPNL